MTTGQGGYTTLPTSCSHFARSMGLWLAVSSALHASEIKLTVTQLTHGPHHHFFGYIGQSLTTPWNGSERYILSLRTTFHNRMPHAGEAADVVLVDTHDHHRVLPIDPAPRWNRTQSALLVPAVVADGTRQLHRIEIQD